MVYYITIEENKKKNVIYNYYQYNNIKNNKKIRTKRYKKSALNFFTTDGYNKYRITHGLYEYSDFGRTLMILVPKFFEIKSLIESLYPQISTRIEYIELSITFKFTRRRL